MNAYALSPEKLNISTVLPRHYCFQESFDQFVAEFEPYSGWFGRKGSNCCGDDCAGVYGRDGDDLKIDVTSDQGHGNGIEPGAGGDVNVNESRVMTFMGGNIVIWSDQGSINAGRGSKTTVSSSGDPDYKYDRNGNLESIILKVPAVGSGLRALTYDPDGSSGPLVPPDPGDIYAFAPNGTIDAGEAGIAGGKITLGATQVLNTKNISFSAGSVGVPSGTDSSVSLGALGGNSNLADSSKMIETATSSGIAKESAKQKLTQAADDFLSKFLDVKVIGFDADTIPASDKDTKEEQEKKKRKK